MNRISFVLKGIYEKRFVLYVGWLSVSTEPKKLFLSYFVIIYFDGVLTCIAII